MFLATRWLCSTQHPGLTNDDPLRILDNCSDISKQDQREQWKKLQLKYLNIKEQNYSTIIANKVSDFLLHFWTTHLFSTLWTRFKQSACCSIVGWLVVGKSPFLLGVRLSIMSKLLCHFYLMPDSLSINMKISEKDVQLLQLLGDV